MGTILGPILGADRPKRGQDEPKRAIRSFKEPKSCIFKNLKKHYVFAGFWVQRPPKRASRGPRRLPRGTQRAPKPKKKLKTRCTCAQAHAQYSFKSPLKVHSKGLIRPSPIHLGHVRPSGRTLDSARRAWNWVPGWGSEAEASRTPDTGHRK